VFETHGKKYGAYLFDRKSNKGKKFVIVAPLPKASSCLEGIDPGIMALPAVSSFDSDEYDLSDIMVFQCPATADGDEGVGGVVIAIVPLNPNYESLPHVLTHKPALGNCEACTVGKMKNLRKYKGAFSR
jgi:hypothetical protein